MNCPRCYTELPDSATTCAQCGAPVRPATFSYLPAGAPPWPTSVPQNFSYGQKAIVQTAQDIRTVEGSIVPKSVVAQKKSSLGIPAIIGLFLVSILIGGGVTFGILYANGQRLSLGPQSAQPTVQLPTSSASSTPTSQAGQLPTPTSFQTITNTDVGISMKYPSDWVTDPAQKTTSSVSVGIHPQQQIGILIAIERLLPSASATVTSTSDINQANLAQFQNAQGFSNFHIVQPATPQPTIGGVQWDEMDATITNSQGVLFHLTTIAVQHNKLYYNIFYFAPNVNYNEAEQKYFQPMLNSFKFLS